MRLLGWVRVVNVVRDFWLFVKNAIAKARQESRFDGLTERRNKS